MNKVLCTTSIYDKGEILEKLDYVAGRDGWIIVLAGDLKTPKITLKNGIYLSPQDQEKMDKKLSDLIGWNNIQRRNFSFLMAHKLNADIWASWDDDNDIYDNWGQDLPLGKEIEFTNYHKTSAGVFDPIGATSNYNHLWHRGFPIQLVSQRDYSNKSKANDRVDIAAFFWDGDPDISQDCRYIYRPECKFNKEDFPFVSDMWGPFNSQNTFFTKEVLPHYFVLTGISRLDDIWASYYVQSLGFKVGYFEPTVYQKRNPQNEDKNMEGEYLGHSQTLKLIKSLERSPNTLFNFLPERSAEAFKQYQSHFNL